MCSNAVRASGSGVRMMDDYDDDAELPFNDGFVRAPPLNGKDNIITQYQIKRASGTTPVSALRRGRSIARDGRAQGTQSRITNHRRSAGRVFSSG